MSKSQDISASINNINRILKLIETAELEFKASVEVSATTLSSLGLSSVLGMSSSSFKDLIESLEMNRSALQISQKRQ
ncbi:MAG: hypothetical protein DRQ40_04695 [Gammaproteobacteria bacterium]|nr:MAG: hypothetical protein DRQ40_04695 [Gammaproteobacteria bacterium]